MRVLVTGATGYLGWRHVALLRERGHDVTALARPGPPRARGGARTSTPVELDAGSPRGARPRRAATTPSCTSRASPTRRARRATRRARSARTPARPLNLLDGCAEHGALLVYPSSARARDRARAGRVRAVQAARRGGLPAAHGARGRAAADERLRPRPGRARGRDGRDLRLRRARARRPPDRHPRQPAAHEGLPLRRRPRRRRGAAARRRGRAFAAALRRQRRGDAARSTPRGIVLDAAGSDVEVEPPRRDASARRGRELRPGAGGAAVSIDARGRSPRRSPRMSTGSASSPVAPASRCSRPRPCLSRSPSGWRAATGAGWSSRSCRRTSPTTRRSTARSPPSTTPCRGRDVVLTAEAPVSWPSGEHVRVDRLTDEARAGIERSARFARRSARPVLTIHLYIPQTAEELRAGAPVDEDAVHAFFALLRAHVRRPRRRAADRERPARAADAHRRRVLHADRRALARPARSGASASPTLGFTLDTSHAALFRAFAARVPVAVRPRVRRGARARALRRGARAGDAGRARLQRARRPRRGAALRPRRARPRPRRRAARRARAVRRRRDQRARPPLLAEHEGRLPAHRARAARAGRALAPAAAPAAVARARLAGGRRPARPGARTCSACRTTSPGAA